MRNRTRDIIKRIAEAQGVTYYYGDWARANLVADKVPDDVVFMVDIQQVRGRMVLWNGSTINDSPEVMWAFMKRLPSEQAVGERDDIHDDIVQECKEMLFRMVAAVNTSGYFEQIDGDFEYEIHPERFDAVFTGVFVQLNIVPTTPMCLDDIEFTPYDPCDDCPPEPCPPCPEPPEPPVEAPIRDVCLFDYDGFCAYSYDAADFLALTELPEPLEHDGLTAQGWNWTLADAQAHVRKYRQLNIGAHYVTDTGETRLYISLLQGMDYQIWLTSTDRANTRIDWGDGTTTEGVGAASNNHTYANGDNYVIKIYPPENGTVELGYGNALYSVLGALSVAANGGRLATLLRAELGKNTNLKTSAFNSAFSLRSLSMPKDTTLGDNVFNSCSKLFYVTIPTNAGTAWFTYNAYALDAVALPYGITTPNNAFNGSVYIRRLTLPESVTTIAAVSFQNHQVLTDFYIPASVTSIGNQAFANNYQVLSWYVYPTTPPTLGTNAFQNINANAKIYVPHGTLTAYQTATNWAAYASYMVEMSE